MNYKQFMGRWDISVSILTRIWVGRLRYLGSVPDRGNKFLTSSEHADWDEEAGA
jgi:hypothetical protein